MTMLCGGGIDTVTLRVLRPHEDSALDGLEIADFPLIIGRSSQVDLQVRDIWASRRHCEIDIVDGQPLVRDMGSKHGTFLNGQRVGQSCFLFDGDEIRVGMTVLTIASEVIGSREPEYDRSELMECEI